MNYKIDLDDLLTKWGDIITPPINVPLSRKELYNLSKEWYNLVNKEGTKNELYDLQYTSFLNITP